MEKVKCPDVFEMAAEVVKENSNLFTNQRQAEIVLSAFAVDYYEKFKAYMNQFDISLLLKDLNKK